MSAGTRYSASHPILAIRSCFNLEGYSVGVVLRFVGFGPPFHAACELRESPRPPPLHARLPPARPDATVCQ